jgi:ADP-heptose:LPS heptosyltransferase
MALLRRNILLFHQGALGDFVLTWPVAMALARIHPQSRVFYVTHEQKGRLAERALGIEWADAEVGWHALFGPGDGPLPDVPGRLLAGAHSVVGFLPSPDGPWLANVRRVTPDANVLTINPTPPEVFTGHASAFQLEQLRPWPAAHAAAEQILRSIDARGVTAKREPNPRHVVVHPGSGSPQKNWPAERYLELVGRLRDAGESVRVLTGEVEHERWPAGLHQQFAAAATVAKPQSYVELMNELLAARAFVGNDSGPGHLAGVLGVPTLSLFGPTDPARWKALGPNVNALRSEPLDALDVDAVHQAVTSLTRA